MITCGVVQAVTHLTTAVTIATARTLLFAMAAHEAGTTGALARDVVAISAVLALAGLGAVLPVEP